MLIEETTFKRKYPFRNLFHTSLGHTLETSLIRLVDLGNSVTILLELLLQLGSIQLAVTASSLDDLGLLVQGEVLPGELWANKLLE